MRYFLSIGLLFILAFSFLHGSLENESSLIQKFGLPKAVIESGARKMLSFESRSCLLEDDQLVSMRFHEENPEEIPLDVVIYEAAAVLGKEPLGVVSVNDGFVRGGKFRKRVQGGGSAPIMSVSGMEKHTYGLDEELVETLESDVRKAYMQFDLGWEPFDRAVLVLHNSKRIDLQGHNFTPIINVYAVRTRNYGSVHWNEDFLIWDRIVASGAGNGADPDAADRVCSETFQGREGFLPKDTMLRFDLGDLSQWLQVDGTVTLIIAHSSQQRFDFYSKDAAVDDLLKPRVLLK